jgi:hypothetical protein
MILIKMGLLVLTGIFLGAYLCGVGSVLKDLFEEIKDGTKNI